MGRRHRTAHRRARSGTRAGSRRGLQPRRQDRSLTGGQDKTARLWDAATGEPIGQPMAHQGGVSAVAFSPDGKTVLTGSGDGTARLWDAATGAARRRPL